MQNVIQNKKSRDSSLNAHYISVHITFWIIQSILATFLVPLLREQGFSSSEIGILVAVRSFSSIIFQNLYASIADKFIEKIPNKVYVCFFALLAIIITIIHATVSLSFLEAIFIFIGYGASVNCMIPFIDAMSTQFISSGRKLNYPLARGIGSFVWALTALILGAVATYFNINSILYIQLGSLLLSIIANVLIEKPDISYINNDKDNSYEKEAHGILYILRNYPFFTIMLISVTLIFTANNISINFLSDKITSINGSAFDIGIGQFALGFCETFVPIYFMYIYKKLNINKLILFAFLFMFLRVVILSLANNMFMIILGQSMELIGGLFWAGSVQFIHTYIPKHDRIKGQSLVAAANMGIGACLGGIIGGEILKYFDVQILYYLSSVFAFIGLTIYFLGMFKFKNSLKETSI